VRVVSIGRDGNPTTPGLERMPDTGEFFIQVVNVFVSRFSQHAVEHFYATK